jgi:hypothetical protein
MKNLIMYLPYIPLYIFVGYMVFLLLRAFIPVLWNLLKSLPYKKILRSGLYLYFFLTVIYIIVVTLF